MEKIFYPESIAIIGLSAKDTNIPRLTLENLLRWGYRGRIFGVNEKSTDDHVDGIRIYRNIEDLPEIPDLAYCMIPAKAIPSVMERCGIFGIRCMAIPSGGFSEYSEEGNILADQLLKIAGKYSIRFVGPNSVTVANTENGLCLPFVALHKAPKGELSIISQSGGIALAMLNYLIDEKIGLAKFASIGNKLDLDEVDFLEYFGKDDGTKIIFLYLESINRGRELISAAGKINKPIIVYKANTTEAGQEAAMSHTAALSNDEDLINSAFQEAGIIRINRFLDFIEVVKAFQLPPMKGKRLMVMSPAGGFAVMGADLCEKAGFELADMGQDFYNGLKKFSNAGVIKFSNPLDMGDIYDPNLTAHVIFSVMHSNNVDGAVFVSQRPQMPAGENIFHRMFLTDLSKETWGSILSSGKPLGVCLFGPNRMIEKTKKSVEFPVFNSPEGMIDALAVQANFHNLLEKRNEPESKIYVEIPGKDAAGKWLAGKQGDYGEEALELAAAYGIPTPRSIAASSAADAAEMAEQIGFPVAMKVISPDAIHKTEAKGVILNINNRIEAENAFNRIRQNLSSFREDAQFVGVRIAEMAPAGYDFFIGGRFDVSFGPVVYFGMGGIFIEVFKDAASLLCPATEKAVLQNFQKLKSAKLLEGLRGELPGDRAAFVDMVVRLSHLLADYPNIVELDLNPVRVFPAGKGALALDARIRLDR